MAKVKTPFVPGNKLWQLAEFPGRPRKFKKPEDFWKAAVAYFDWCESNPIPEEKIFCHQGITIKDTVYHMRAMTIQGFCVHANISDETFYEYEKKPEFSGIVEHVRKCIYEQKLTGAAADQLNASIISRELGLAEKVENEVKAKVEYLLPGDSESPEEWEKG